MTAAASGTAGTGTDGALVEFSWTHHRGHGPDESLLQLAPGARVLDLGCGKGRALAYLARHYDIDGTGIDANPAMVEFAEAHFGRSLRFGLLDAVDYLQWGTTLYDAVYSRFGAAWFTDPDRLLPELARRVRPGGVFVTAHMRPGFREFTVPRFDLAPQQWQQRLCDVGFDDITCWTVDCPDDCHDAPNPGIMILQAIR